MITVIIPCFNSSKYVDLSINSILNQSYIHKISEIILIDDDSKDFNELSEIVGKFKKKFKNISLYKNSSNKGPGFSRNLGIKKSITKYIAFLDSDDHWHHDKIKFQIDIFNKYPNINMLCSLNESSVIQDRKLIKLNLISMLFKNQITTSSVILEKNNFFFKETYYCEDYFLWINMLINKFNIYRLNIKLVNNNNNKSIYTRLTSKKTLMHSHLQKIFFSLYLKIPLFFIFIIFAQLFALIKFLLKSYK